jgi:Cytochrome c554 and c-prime
MRLSREVAVAFVAGTLLLVSATLLQGQAPSASSKTKATSSGSRGPDGKTKTLSIPRSDYVGDEACASCHQDKIDSYEKTAHHNTAQVANKKSIAGIFSPSANTMQTANPNLTFRMDSKGGEFFQTAIWGTPPNERTHTQRFDLVIGSGGKGQTYLFWDDNQLFQLPVSYSTVLRQWINSPGYKDGTANFDRGIIPRCLECHATYFESKFSDPSSNFYNTKNFVLSISCERCHGPGRGHVESYERKASKSKSPSAALIRPIVNPAKLSRKLRADICVQCHGGQGNREILPAFSYVPGQPLENYIDLGPIDPTQYVDVHGKQEMLLMQSKCFQASPDMTCSTCHDVHKPEPELVTLNQRCLSCHKLESTGRHAQVGTNVANNCVDCHMPTLESKIVELDVDGRKIRQRFRTHWIKIYSKSELQ